jgi:hypothetical protein
LATTSTTLSFVDERQFLTEIQPVLPLHECADPASAESTTEPLHSLADSAPADPANVESLHSSTDPVGSGESLHSATDPTGSGAALTRTFCLCIQV